VVAEEPAGEILKGVGLRPHGPGRWRGPRGRRGRAGGDRGLGLWSSSKHLQDIKEQESCL